MNTRDIHQFSSDLFTFSTADIERTIFFGQPEVEKVAEESFGEATLIVVNGEWYQLRNEVPPLSIPFLDRPALTGLVGLDSQEE